MKKIVVLFVLMTLLLSGCLQKEPELYKDSYLDLFDTHCEIMIYAQSESEFREIIVGARDVLKKYDILFDIYDDFEGVNNIKTINNNAGIKPVKVDKDIIDLIKYSKDMYEKTNGNVNIAFGPVLKIWHDYRTQGIENEKEAKLPSIDLLKQANKLTNIDDVIIDESNSTVFLNKKGMSLDVGSIAKGYATQKLAEYLVSKDVNSFLLNMGGNVKSYGLKADGKKWKLAIQNPNLSSNKKYLEKLYFESNSLVTSGDYQRFYTVNGKKYNHIINKDTLMPSEKFKSVSVVTEDSTYADAITTALFNMDFNEGYKFVESVDNLEALWVFKDMSVRKTKGFSKYQK